VPETQFGSAHPLLVQAVGAGGQWVIGCQARHDTDGNGRLELVAGMHGAWGGDLLVPYLMTPERPLGEGIDLYIASDASGRYLVYAKAGRLWLRDAQGPRTHDLGEVARRSDGTLEIVRAAASFDRPAPDESGAGSRARWNEAPASSARRLVFPRGPANARRVVLRELDTGKEQDLPIRDGILWQSRFAGDALVSLAMVTADTDGSGSLEAPRFPHGHGGGPCGGPMQETSATWPEDGFAGDAWLPLTLDVVTLREEPRRVIGGFGRGALLQERGGALVFRGADGVESLQVPASCRSHVVAVDPVAPAVLATCGPDDQVLPLQLFRDGNSTLISGETNASGLVGLETSGRVAVVNGVHLVDLATGHRAPDPAAAYFGFEHETGSIVEARGVSVRLRRIADTDGQPEVVELLRLPDSSPTRGAVVHGDYVAIAHGRSFQVVHVPSRQHVGQLGSMPLAMLATGAALVLSERNGQAVGPLRWVMPSFAPADDRGTGQR
jgi:hypothetical protein